MAISSLVKCGGYAEAKQIATRLRVLLYDGGPGRSLLKQLGLKEELRFHDVAGDLRATTVIFLWIAEGVRTTRLAFLSYPRRPKAQHPV
jgi:hypothetical protein